MRGTISGLIAGYIFLAYVGGGIIPTEVAEAGSSIKRMDNGLLATVGSLLDSGAFIGFFVHILVSAVIGNLYAILFVQYLDFGSPLPNILVGGSIYGLLWWILGWNIILPTLQGTQTLQLSLDSYLFGHIMFGQALAYSVALFNAVLYSTRAYAEGCGYVALSLLLGIALISLFMTKRDGSTPQIDAANFEVLARVSIIVAGSTALVWAASTGAFGRLWSLSIRVLKPAWKVIMKLLGIGWIASKFLYQLVLAITKSITFRVPVFRHSFTAPPLEEHRRLNLDSSTTFKVASGEHLESTIVREYKEIQVYAEWKSHTFAASLQFFEAYHSRSRVSFEGVTMSPSKAALQAINSINPEINSVNGWKFWKLLEPAEDKGRPIYDLRLDEKLLQRVRSDSSA